MLMLTEKPFEKAMPVWAEGEEKTMNLSCVFAWEIGACSELILRLTASCFYRAFLNGELVAYGPARAAHGLFRADEWKLFGATREKNDVVIEVAGYNCKSFYSLDQPSFLQAEGVADGKIVFATGENSDCRILTERLRKTARFSFQRSFTECYRFNLPPQSFASSADFGKKVAVRVSEPKKIIPRGVDYPVFKEEKFDFTEWGTFERNPERKFPDMRYLIEKEICIFDRDELEVKPFDEAFGLTYRKNAAETYNGALKSGEYALFRFPYSLTGFIVTGFTAKTDAEVLVLFEEVDNRTKKVDNQPIAIDFWRNDSINIIDYAVKKGEFKHISFEPYTAAYIKIVALSGEIELNETGMIRYENPNTGRMEFKCDDEKLNVVTEAARRTLAQNSVDILTDCPSRERAGWLCDSYFSSRAEKLFTGGNAVERVFLENYAYQSENIGLGKGILAMCYPADFGKPEFIPNWMMFYLLELEDNFRRTGNEETRSQSEERARGVVSYFKKFENEYGLLENLENWVFVEWSRAGDLDYVKGVNFPSNMLYAAALAAFGELYGKKEYVEKAEKLKETIRKLSFDGEFFEDNAIRKDGGLTLVGHTTETCQYYAFYFGTATRETHPALYNALLEKFGPLRDETKVYPSVAKSNAFIGNMLRSDYLVREGLGNKFLEEAREFYYGMASVTGTLWEHDRNQCSLNHGFGAYAANMIVLSLSGYRYTDETSRTVHIKKVTSPIGYRISIPVNGGFVKLENGKDGKTVSAPDGYSVSEE